MKLRCKETGEVIELNLVRANCEYLINHKVDTIYGEELSLKTLNKYYEDYTQKEPLIKDEKIRKAVRAWAEVNSIEKALYAERPDRSLCLLTDMGENDYNIDFVGWIPTLKDGDDYTIAELCGEEEQ